MKSFNKSLKEFMKNPEFKKAYEDLEPQYEAAREIIKKRLELKMSQEKLAEISGIKQANIARMESGQANITLGTLDRIAKSMGSHVEIRIKKDRKAASA